MENISNYENLDGNRGNMIIYGEKMYRERMGILFIVII